jgi:sugar lactone lactonase YvrE
MHLPGLHCLRALLVASALIPVSALAQTNFGAVNLGSGSAATVTVIIPAAGTVSSIAVVTQGASNLDFTNAGGGTCANGNAYAAKATCTVKVSFAPRFAGTRYGAVVLFSSSASQSVLATAFLEGAGVGQQHPQIAFAPSNPVVVGTNSSGNPNAGGPPWAPCGVSFAVAADAGGNVYLDDCGEFDGIQFQIPPHIDKFTPSNGQYSATSIGAVGAPEGLAVDGSGNLYVADNGLDILFVSLPPITAPPAVYKETLQPDGSYTQSAIGSGWVCPVGIAVDANGNLFVADSGNPPRGATAAPAIYKETLQPDGTYVQTRIFSGLSGQLAVDASGNLYIAAGSAVYKETPQANGTYLQTSIGSGLTAAIGVAVDGLGDVYVAQGGDIYRETPQPGGSYEQSIAANSPSPTNGWISLWGVAADGSGDLFLGNLGDVTVYEVIPPRAPSLSFAATVPGVTSSDSPQTVAVSNTGGGALKFSEVTYPADFPQAPSAKNACAPGTSLAPGASCNLTIDFTPEVTLGAMSSLTLNESVTVVTNSQNIADNSQSIPVSGTETKVSSSVSIAPTSLNPAAAGVPVTFSATVTGGSPGAPAPTGTVAFNDGTALCSATLSGATASCSASFTAGGTYTVAAAYAGDEHYLGASSSGTTEFVLANPGASILPYVNAGTVTVGNVHIPFPVMVTFDKAETLGGIAILTQGIAGMDFTNAGGGTCTVGTAYLTQARCTVDVAFAPRFAGVRIGAVVLSDNNGNPIGTGYLQGYGVAPQTTFLPGTRTTIGSNLSSAESVTVDAAGNLYLGVWLSYSGGEVVSETLQPDGSYNQANIGSVTQTVPYGVAVDGSGNLYVTNGAVYKYTPLSNGRYSQAVIGYGYSCPINMTVNLGIAVDWSGNVFVADRCNHAVHKLALQSNGGYTDTTIGSGWSTPNSIAVDGSGNVYVTDSGTGALYKESPASGHYTQSTIGSSFGDPVGVAVDGAGSVYVVDGKAGNVYKETLSSGVYSQSTIVSGLSGLGGIAVGGSGNIYIAFSTSAGGGVYKLDLADPPALTFPATAIGSRSGPQTETVANIGNATLNVYALNYPAGFPEAQGVTNDCKSTTSLAAGASCTLSVDFTPGTIETYSKTLLLKDNNLNAPGQGYDHQTLALSGIALGTQTISFSPAPTVTYGVAPLTLTATGGLSGDPVTFTVTGPAKLTGNTLRIIGAGTVVITANQAGNSEYEPAPTVTRIVVVEKAPLTVTAKNASRLFGAANPDFGYTIAGFVNGEVAVHTVTGAPSLTTTATATSPVGTYPISAAAGTLAAANYKFQFKDGTLTVNPIGTAAKPEFTPAAGTYTSAQQVTIKDSTTGAVIYYSVGNPPGAPNIRYTGAITVSATETVNAIAIAPGYTNSAVASSAYTIK